MGEKLEGEWLEIFDQAVEEIQAVSEIVNNSWQQVFNSPLRNLFKKIDFDAHEKIVRKCHADIAAVRSHIAAGSLASEPYFELDRFARFLDRFCSQLLDVIQKLNMKADGNNYSIRDYRNDVKLLENNFDELTSAQKRYNEYVHTIQFS